MTAEPASIHFSIPALPARASSTNGDRAHHTVVSEHKMQLSSDTNEAILSTFGADIPAFTSAVDITVVGYVRFNARPHIEQCPRCLVRALEGAVWWTQAKGPHCCCYRPLDASNLGGNSTKPIPDTMKRLGIIVDDDWKHVRRYTTELRQANSVTEEHMEVFVSAVVEN